MTRSPRSDLGLDSSYHRPLIQASSSVASSPLSAVLSACQLRSHSPQACSLSS